MNYFTEHMKQFWEWCLTEFNNMAGSISESIGDFFSNFNEASEIYTLTVRWIFSVLTLAIFLRCMLPLLHVKKRNGAWGYLNMADGSRVPLNHWENSIGRSRSSDIVINLAFISRSHAVLTFCDGVWSITDLGSKGGVKVNGEKIEKSGVVKYGDVISLAGLEMVLASPGEESAAVWENDNPETASADKNKSIVSNKSTDNNMSIDNNNKYTGNNIKSGVTLFLIFISQILGSIQICLSMNGEVNPAVPLAFLLFIIAEYLYYVIMRLCSRKYFELELLGYFLCGLNLLIVASASPNSLYKQLISILMGIAAYTVLGILIQDLGRARKVKYILAACALVLLALNLAIGETRFGAKNWINLGFITFQPLEFVKVAFVIAGTATLDRLLTKRNMTAFIGFSGACICALVLIRDFGTAVVFFGTFIVIAFMRSGDLRTIALITSGAILGAIMAISFLPYIASRFATWGHAWEYANTSGYQQTRTMIAVASGGLVGVGGGNGYLSNVSAADTDLVFGMLSEEWGLLAALTVVFIIIFIAIYAVLLTKNCRSSFYAIAACGAASIFLIQTGLNVFGSLDILPLTGVTIPFVSNGGSSMITSWGLLAFIKSADERMRLNKFSITRKKRSLKS